MFPCQRLLFSATKKKWEVKFCASNIETTVIYSKLHHQGNSSSGLNIEYSKPILVTRCKKRVGRKRKTIQKVTSWSNSNSNTIGSKTYAIPTASQSSVYLLASFSPFAEIVTRGQQGSLQPPTRAEAEACLRVCREVTKERLEICKIPTRQLKHSSVQEREAFKKKMSRWLEGMRGVAATWISYTAVPLAVAAEMQLWFWSPWVTSMVWRRGQRSPSLPHPPALTIRLP